LNLISLNSLHFLGFLITPFTLHLFLSHLHSTTSNHYADFVLKSPAVTFLANYDQLSFPKEGLSHQYYLPHPPPLPLLIPPFSSF